MRKVMYVAVLFMIVVAMTGCTAFYTPTGFAVPTGGMIYTNTIFASAANENDQLDYTIIKKVHGTSVSTCILGIVSIGDSGLNSAIKNALEELPEADGIINKQVDTEVRSILMLFTEVTTHVRGDAVTYVKTNA